MGEFHCTARGELAELTDGRLYYMAPPSTVHQRLVHFFDREIGNYIRDKQGGAKSSPSLFNRK